MGESTPEDTPHSRALRLRKGSGRKGHGGSGRSEQATARDPQADEAVDVVDWGQKAGPRPDLAQLLP